MPDITQATNREPKEIGLGALARIADDASRHADRVSMEQTEAVIRAAIRYGLVTVNADA